MMKDERIACNNNNNNNQILVRFANHQRTFVVDLPPSASSSFKDASWIIRQHVSRALLKLIKPEQLQVTQYAPPFCNCRIVSRILGGKGGFGTLLKGQSRQASAHTTKDFSACRDLQGRRLRHVNDAIQYSIWKEWNDKVEAGTSTLEEMAAALVQTESGVAGWHLQLPAWAEVNKSKEQQRLKRLLRSWKRNQERTKAVQNEQRQQQERQVASYVQVADDATAKLQSTLSVALQQGLEKQQQQQQEQQEASNKRLKTTTQEVAVEPPAALLTLSGDAVLVPVGNDENEDGGVWRIQSDSNFCTVGIVLDKNKQKKMTVSSSKAAKAARVLYYEVALVTAGIVQVGWATTAFRPNSETGDGVGDCANSWGFDGSRKIKLHNAKIEPYDSGSTTQWQPGNVVGCTFDLQTGEISYAVNGRRLANDGGVAAFGHVPTTSTSSVFPVVSVNPGEVVELRLTAAQFKYPPTTTNTTSDDVVVVVPVGDIMATQDVTLDSLLLAEDLGSSSEDDEDEEKVAAAAVENNGNNKKKTSRSVVEDEIQEQQAKSDTTPPKPAAAIVVVEPLDLGQYESVQQLQDLGLDRLKGALMAIGLKCGGTLQERAARLFSVRGLEPADYPEKLRAKKKQR